MPRNLFLKFLRKNQTQILKIIPLILILAIYSWFFFRNLAMLPDPNDPLEYIAPSVWHTLVDIYPWLDRIIIADSIRLFSLVMRPEIAGAVYFGLINYLILIIATIWAYRQRGFWTAFLCIFFLSISYPLLRYANYGYSDATVALFSLLAFIVCFRAKKRSFLWAGIFTALAFFSKVTGLAVLIFFLADMLFKKDFQGLKNFFLGIIIGVATAFSLTILLFGFESLKETILKIGFNFSSNTEPRSIIADSGYNILHPEILLPGYLALIVFIAGYKDFLIRKLFLFSLFFIGFFAILVIFSHHVIVYPHYLFTAYIFASIGMSFYLAKISQKISDSTKYFLAFSSVVLVFLGITLGLARPNFLESYLEYAPTWFKASYVIFFLIIILLMVLIASLKKTSLAIVFIILMAFFGSLFTSASAYSYIHRQKLIATSAYVFAQILGQSPSAEVKVYADFPNETSKNRALWVYSLFYDHQHNRDSASKNQEDIARTITFIEEKNLDSDWNFLLTDNEKEVRLKFPQANIIKALPEFGLYLFSRS